MHLKASGINPSEICFFGQHFGPVVHYIVR
jgi:hypothetical protein